MKMFKTKGSPKQRMFKPGETVVIVGANDLDREIVVFQSPEQLVEDIAASETVEYPSNEAFMRAVASRLGEIAAIPFHSEEAFVGALIDFGLVQSTTLH